MQDSVAYSSFLLVMEMIKNITFIVENADDNGISMEKKNTN
jgi:hypothetical protein